VCLSAFWIVSSSIIVFGRDKVEGKGGKSLIFVSLVLEVVERGRGVERAET
jgi:hypothetical protein